MFSATIEEFKAQFPRFSPMYLPYYEQGKTYFKDDIVYYYENKNFYKCIVNNTDSLPTDSQKWELYNDSTLNYTTDLDILEALEEASICFNHALFEDCNKARTAFLMLAAHFLTVDFNNALGINQSGITTSKSVGSVSEGFTVPDWLRASPVLSAYATTGYGVKYASLIQPYLAGQILLIPGRTTYD